MGLCCRCVLPSQGWTLRRNNVQKDEIQEEEHLPDFVIAPEYCEIWENNQFKECEA